MPGPDKPERVGSTSVWLEIRERPGFLRRQPGHTTLLTMATSINLFLVPAFALLPQLVLERGSGAMQLGGMTSIFGVGSLAGGIALGILGGFRRRIVTTLAGMIALGLATAALAFAPTIPWMMVAMAAVGLALAAPVAEIAGALLTLRRRADLRARCPASVAHR